MRFLHPVSVLSFGSRGLPPDLALEARDTLMLYQALEKTPGILTAKERERLRPLNFFPSSRPLRQEDVLGYESELKCVVNALMDATKAGKEETSPLLAVTKRLADPRIREVDNTRLNTLPDDKEFLGNLLGLLCDLHVQGDLVSNSPSVGAHSSHHPHATLHSPRFFSASTVPPVRRLPVVSLQSSRKPKNNGERYPLNGQKKCGHTRPGRLEQDNGRNRGNVLQSRNLPKGMAHKVLQPMLHGRHHSTLQNLPRISVLPGTTSTFRRKMWIMRSLVSLNGVEWTNASLRP